MKAVKEEEHSLSKINCPDASTGSHVQNACWILDGCGVKLSIIDEQKNVVQEI